MKHAKINLIMAMLIFGSIGLFVRYIDLPSSQVALTRGVVGCLFLLATCLVSKQKLSWKAIRPNQVLLILSGAAIGFNWIFLFEAYKYTTIPNATLSYYFAPVIVTLLSPFILKERLTITKMLCIVGAVLGMFFIVGVGEGSGDNNLVGIGYGLMAAVLYSSVILMNKFLKRLSGIETTLMQLGIASIVLLPYVLATDKIQFNKIDSKVFALLLVIGMVHTGFAYLLYFTAMQKLSGQTIAVFSYIDPISAIVMSSLFLGEHMTIPQIFGGILILGATFLSEFYNKSVHRNG